jgi:hypothetical protein
MRVRKWKRNKYSIPCQNIVKKAQDKVEHAMHEMKEGTLKSGHSGKRVTDPKQAIAIGLSEQERQMLKFLLKRNKSRTREEEVV